MKTKILLPIIVLITIASCFIFGNCGGGGGGKDSIIVEQKPLNLTVLLDLSDRLERVLTPSQMERDTAIVNYLVKQFQYECTKNKNLLQCKNAMRVLFYPTPQISDVANLANNLDIDLAKCQYAEKKRALVDMPQNFKESLAAIYDKTLQQKQWVGSDIWGFFSNNKVDQYCIKQDYRNVVVILTDGFLYDKYNKQNQNGNEYSYLLPQTLNVENSKLIVKRQGLENLEVLMLEVNPYDPTKSELQIKILQDWFNAMGVDKTVITETSLPNTTRTVIDNFFN